MKYNICFGNTDIIKKEKILKAKAKDDFTLKGTFIIVYDKDARDKEDFEAELRVNDEPVLKYEEGRFYEHKFFGFCVGVPKEEKDIDRLQDYAKIEKGDVVEVHIKNHGSPIYGFSLNLFGFKED